MKDENKTRILDSWDIPDETGEARVTELLGDVHAVQMQATASEVPLPGTLNAPPQSRWPSRLLKLGVMVALGGAALQWSQWAWASWQWHPVAGGLVAGAGALLGAVGLFALRDLRRQRHRLSELEQLRHEMQSALKDPSQRLAVDWLDRLAHVYAATPLAARLSAACADLDAAHDAEEVSRRLNLQFYQAIDQQARQIVRNESVGTGLLVASSPWVSVDLMLVVWRNIRMMQRIAVCYGLPIGRLSRWRLARHVLRNIALAGGTEMAMGALSDSLLSGLLEKLAARIGQGMGIGLYSARLGHFTLDLCRAVPLSETGALLEDNKGIIRTMKERLGRTSDDKL
ncbi:DUF697 domain-containing protein [Pseudomonas neustonica]|uniref:DUF697 domain-containing protein n=1 Tax=Pseudomonas neustonica TaxID=2487346 RepID=A0ABX9XE75_9PSED|nr:MULTISPECIES: TIGR01620 family protein [Pseudomonas]ROZ81453.1 DUF697 domain-containing protein [Pseudomonas neustonica]ROZ82623.1 DUF697 domain-containing protein [Pseudomonas sp. SSM44]